MDEFGPITSAPQTCLGSDLEKAFSGIIGGLSGCGSGTAILFLLLVLSLVINVLQQRNATKMLLKILSIGLSTTKEDKDDEFDEKG